MTYTPRSCCFLLCVAVFSAKAYCWNAIGHRLIAEIAYHHLTDQARQRCDSYNQALNTVYKPQSFVDAAVWLDGISYQYKGLKPLHYIDTPFSVDGSPLVPANKINAILAIKQAKKMLKNPLASDFEKGLNLRVLLHLVGDLHQPMHAANQFSARFPRGDLGGNLFKLGTNGVASNLHAYWDRGGGLLLKTPQSDSIEKQWPCRIRAMKLNPSTWATESHQLAVNQAYLIQPTRVPDVVYEMKARELSSQRIALAGCRLAATLNKVVQ